MAGSTAAPTFSCHPSFASTTCPALDSRPRFRGGRYLTHPHPAHHTTPVSHTRPLHSAHLPFDCRRLHRPDGRLLGLGERRFVLDGLLVIRHIHDA
eukprot:scaffold299985_cov32-Tisochrysis_lutea.AAC.1